MSIKKRNAKITKSYIMQTQEISLEEKCENYKTVFMQELSGVKADVLKLANTNMDKAVAKNKELERRGKYDLSAFYGNAEPPEDELYLFETDKELRCANGY
jgi:hypothetical protein